MQNRVGQILNLKKGQEWHHCPGPEHPSNIGSRGALPSELLNNILWWRGPPPQTEHGKEYWPQTNAANLEPDDECLKEIKRIDLLQDPTTLLTHAHKTKGQISNLTDCQNFINYNKLLQVTAYVIKFVNILRDRIKKLKQGARDISLTATELLEAENLWLRDIQVHVRSDPKFKQWEVQLAFNN